MIAAPVITDMIESYVRAQLATLRTPLHAAIILDLGLNGKRGSSEFAKRYDLDASTVSSAMRSLMASNMVLREKVRGRVYFSLTPEGESLAAQMLQDRRGGQS